MRAPRAPRAPFLLLLLSASLVACAGPALEMPEPQRAPEPDPSQVERILFLIGDAGEATSSTSPLLNVLERDVEEWSARLEADSAVAVLYLGDIRYPYGLRRRDSEHFAGDTASIMAQIRVVAGPRARERGAQAYFIPGNHDWGMRKHFEGYERLKRLDDFLVEARELTGAPVRMAPEPGRGGPVVLDWGAGTRLLLLDTAWWLMYADAPAQADLLVAVEQAMASAGDRTVVFAAHHPFLSVGMHGGRYSLTEKLGIGYILRRAGAFVQSLNAPPYRELTRGLRRIFARHGPPFAFIGGHDHSLQVIGRVQETDPVYNIVSGAGSKLTDVGPEPGLYFARSAPGYMRLLLEKDGGAHLSVVAAPRDYLLCPEDEGPSGPCMREGMAAFEVVHSQRLR